VSVVVSTSARRQHDSFGPIRVPHRGPEDPAAFIAWSRRWSTICSWCALRGAPGPACTHSTGCLRAPLHARI